MYYNKPVSTRGIAGTGSGMLRCAKNQNRTRNRGTRFKSTAGLPVPVLNPKHHWTLQYNSSHDPHFNIHYTVYIFTRDNAYLCTG